MKHMLLHLYFKLINCKPKNWWTIISVIHCQYCLKVRISCSGVSGFCLLPRLNHYFLSIANSKQNPQHQTLKHWKNTLVELPKPMKISIMNFYKWKKCTTMPEKTWIAKFLKQKNMWLKWQNLLYLNMLTNISKRYWVIFKTTVRQTVENAFFFLFGGQKKYCGSFVLIVLS